MNRCLTRIAGLLRLIREHPERILKFLRSLSADGLRSTLARTKALLAARTADHHHYRYRTCSDPEIIRSRIESLSATPLITVLMPVYDVDIRWLERAVESVHRQTYTHWELLIVDDGSTRRETREFIAKVDHPRIRTFHLEVNRGIAAASNLGLAQASGEFIAFLDHDDELTPDALLEIACAIDDSSPDVLYSDEDFVGEDGVHRHPHFKPDFSPDLLLSHNYITHLLVARRQLIIDVGGFRPEFDGAQDYDLLLRLMERTTEVKHIPMVLYHWRTVRSSTARDPSAKTYAVAAGRNALRDALARRGIRGTVHDANLPNYYRVQRSIDGNPLISILIPFRDQPDLLRTCLESVLDVTSYPNFEIVGIDNASTRPETHQLMQDIRARDSRVGFLRYDHPFNYSAINNFAAARARGDHLVLMNNDIEVLVPDWIQALLEHSQRPEVGAVGAKLYYGETSEAHRARTIQHAGVVLGIGGFAGHSHRHVDRAAHGYFNRLSVIQNVSAVTGALMMVKKRLFDGLGGLDAERFGVALNDIDFCLRLVEEGYLNVFTPFCEALHNEGASRGSEDTPEKRARFEREIFRFRERHGAVLERGDPFYNPNLTLRDESFSPRPSQPL